MLNEGFILMGVGMGTVFVFLTILWGAVAAVGKVVEKLNELFPEQVQEVKKVVKNAAGSSDAEVAIAVAAAKLRK